MKRDGIDEPPVPPGWVRVGGVLRWVGGDFDAVHGLTTSPDCGTAPARRRHRAHGEDWCLVCGDTAPRTKGGRPLQPISHGTGRGYQAHLRRGEAACDDCMDANREKSRRQSRTKQEVAA